MSVHDLEGVYVRILKDGEPKNVFMAVEELHHATAVGHCAALNAVFQKVGLPEWKQKLAGFGSDGAPVMVEGLGGSLFYSGKKSPTSLTSSALPMD
ncbi:hypothetical protein AAFF_G00115770 [Aldrovandia affinis]|uniref:Uncharacterized protein n=1 Tax=Aldrovandia affinis TaxID=143900 RepID=A0AAD7T393_9TELE|nr:hypothetical protein AAFF_G00115770 [Aldrovandia affinis]